MFVVFLVFIFIRPLISSLAFSYLNLTYSTVFLIFLTFWFIRLGFAKIKIALNPPLVLFILALIISLFFSVDKLLSLNELYKYLTYFLIFLISFSLSNKEKSGLIHTIILSGFFIGILAIYQYFFGFHHVIDYVEKKGISDQFVLDYINRKRVFFPFVTPNALAGYLILVMPLILIIKKRLIWLILLSVLSALLLTKSLGALLSLLLGLSFYFFLRKDLPKKKFILLLVVIICAAFIFALRQNVAQEHTVPTFSMLKRLDYWRHTLKIITAHSLTGIGIGNFNLVSSRYAHNLYLQLWAEMGILGLVSFLWLTIYSLKTGFKNIKKTDQKLQFIVLITSTITFLAHNIIDFTFYLPEVCTLWWAILGMNSSTE